MIFVVFGTVPIPFLRLARKIEELAAKIDEEFIVQYGHTQYPFKKAKAFSFLSYSEMQSYIDSASIIITHGGYGTISECLKKSKKVIAVPRLKGEHNHSQEELVKALEEKGYIIGVYNINDLEDKIKQAVNFTPMKIERSDVSKIINDFLRSEV